MTRLAYAVTAAALTFIATQAPSLMTTDTPTVRYMAVARADKAGQWRLIDDAGHSPVGFTTPHCVGTSLVIDFPQQGRILTASSQADETLVSLGVAAGVSAGVDRLVVKFARNGVPIACNSAVLATVGANVWLSVDLEAVLAAE